MITPDTITTLVRDASPVGEHSAMTVLLAEAPPAPPTNGVQLIIAALVGIAVIVLLITWLDVHPFLALILGSLAVAVVAGFPLGAAITSFGNGFGSTAASVGTLIALGAMFGKLLADSGGADQIVDTIVGRSSERTLPWAMALVGAIIGLPMFFEIGLVLIMPVIYLVARRSRQSIIAIGIPALAGLSAMHGLVPPHPGPLAAIGLLKANLGLTLALGVLVAIPTVVVAGPLFARFAARWVDVTAPETYESGGSEGGGTKIATRRPTFAITLTTVLLPVVLMLGKALVDIFLSKTNPVYVVLDFLGTPVIALLLSVIVAMFTFGRGAGMERKSIMGSVESALPPIAGIVLIVAAGGGFKQVLVDTKIGDLVTGWVQGSGFSVLLLGWLIAVFIRLATGSATVATVTSAGLLTPLVPSLSPGTVSLLVLAVGVGSLFFSHVNDAGFWLVKQYFGLGVGQTIKTWSLMETLISVVGLVFVLLLGLVV